MFALCELGITPDSQQYRAIIAAITNPHKLSILRNSSFVRIPSELELKALASLLRCAALDDRKRFLAYLKARSFLPTSSCRNCSAEVEYRWEERATTAPACDCGFHLVQIDDYLMCEDTLRRADWSQLAITSEQSADTQMQSLLGSLCQAATHVELIDIYALCDMNRAEKESVGSSGLARFLQLCADRGVKTVTMHASRQLGRFHLDEKDEVRNQLITGLRSHCGSLAFILRLYDQQGMKRIAHDRWLNFQLAQESFSVSIGPGLSAFDGDAPRQQSTFSPSNPASFARTLSKIGDLDFSEYTL